MTMQVRIWGTPAENQEMIDLLWSSLGEKIKIVSQPYPSVHGVTQRIYMEIDLENKNYRKCPIDNISNREDV